MALLHGARGPSKEGRKEETPVGAGSVKAAEKSDGFGKTAGNVLAGTGVICVQTHETTRLEKTMNFLRPIVKFEKEHAAEICAAYGIFSFSVMLATTILSSPHLSASVLLLDSLAFGSIAGVFSVATYLLIKKLTNNIQG